MTDYLHAPLTVVLPTYNEAENLPEMVATLCRLPLSDLHLVVVDDDSPDSTGQVAESLARGMPGRFRVLHRAGKLGLGTAYLAGFRMALATGAAAVIQMDADLSHSPGDLPRLLERLGECDVVVGSRYVAGGKLDLRWGQGRRLLSWWGNFYSRLILGLELHDVTAGYKAWRRETLMGMDLGRIRSNGYVFQVEMAYVAQKLGYQACEIPIYFEDRRIGRSKMDTKVKLEAAWRVWQVWWLHHNLTPASRLTPGQISQDP
jgi:dolichol-phosphate mannosyltransferase